MKRIGGKLSNPNDQFQGRGVPEMRERLEEIVGGGNWPLLEPLPVTRFLGSAFGVSNVSAYRVLSSLARQNVLWKAPNGRYFAAGARRLLERPLPVACLFRRLERWTELSRLLIEGADAACGECERALLLIHDRALFHQSNPEGPVTAETDEKLLRSLEDFLNLHGERTNGILLDELWPDRILAKFRRRLRNAVILHRRTSLRFLGSASADFSAIARLACEHARMRGFDRLLVLLPSHDYEPSLQAAAALEKLGAPGPGKPQPVVFHPAATFPKRLAAALKSRKKHGERVLMVATEDNLAVRVLELIQEMPDALPATHGILSTMGTPIARNRRITCVATDFRRLGELATRMAIQGELEKVALSPELFQGSTT